MWGPVDAAGVIAPLVALFIDDAQGIYAYVRGLVSGVWPVLFIAGAFFGFVDRISGRS